MFGNGACTRVKWIARWIDKQVDKGYFADGSHSIQYAAKSNSDVESY